MILVMRSVSAGRTVESAALRCSRVSGSWQLTPQIPGMALHVRAARRP